MWDIFNSDASVPPTQDVISLSCLVHSTKYFVVECCNFSGQLSVFPRSFSATISVKGFLCCIDVDPQRDLKFCPQRSNENKQMFMKLTKSDKKHLISGLKLNLKIAAKITLEQAKRFWTKPNN